MSLTTSGSYVPPHLRKLRTQGGETTALPQLTASPTSGNRTSFYTLDEICTQLGGSHNTIGESAADPPSVSRFIVHDGQHPEWPPKLFCKTNLALLPNLDTASAEAKEREYPVFEQIPFHTSQQKFEFSGWWKIAAIRYLEPNSEELIAMHTKKATIHTTTRASSRSMKYTKINQPEGKARTEQAWKDSLSRSWAVISLEKTPRTDNPMDDTGPSSAAGAPLKPCDLLDTPGCDGASTIPDLAEKPEGSEAASDSHRVTDSSI